MSEVYSFAYEVKWFGETILCAKKYLQEEVIRMRKGKVGDNWNSCCREACRFGNTIGGT